jgi:hypothetical protein
MPQTPTLEQRQAWMAQWRSAAVALEQVRQAEWRAADLRVIATQLEELSLAAVRANPPGSDSGLVVQQAFFHRARRL